MPTSWATSPQNSPPTVHEVERAMQSAEARGIDILSIPPYVVLGDYEKSKKKYWSYCLRCRAWMSYDESLRHQHCAGQSRGHDIKDIVAKNSEWRSWLEAKAEKNDKNGNFGAVEVDHDAGASTCVGIEHDGKGRKRMHSVTHGEQPTEEDIDRAMSSAQGTQLKCFHKMPDGVIIARRDKTGQYGPRGDYYAYCLKCDMWFSCGPKGEAKAVAHTCTGEGWNQKLVEKVNDEWGSTIRRMRKYEAQGCDPYLGDEDCREIPFDEVELVKGRKKFLRWEQNCLLPGVPLDFLLSIPDEPDPSGVVLYFHGHSENIRSIPADDCKHAVIAVQCPKRISDGAAAGAKGSPDCFWFYEGHESDWLKFKYDKLKPCRRLLDGVKNLALDVIRKLRSVEASCESTKLQVIGCSMGGHAALEFCKHCPDFCSAACTMAGYYDTSYLQDLVETISAVPLLVIHYRGDTMCPLKPIAALVEQRDPRNTCAKILPGKLHSPNEKERQLALNWLHENQNL